MGAWGPGIFEDDVALDVRDFVDGALARGSNMREATQLALAEFNEVLEDSEDPDDASIVWLALAAVQVDRGQLHPEVRQRALAIIEGGADLERWHEAGPEMVAQRRRVLSELRRRHLAADGGVVVAHLERTEAVVAVILRAELCLLSTLATSKTYGEHGASPLT